MTAHTPSLDAIEADVVGEVVHLLSIEWEEDNRNPPGRWNAPICGPCSQGDGWRFRMERVRQGRRRVEGRLCPRCDLDQDIDSNLMWVDLIFVYLRLRYTKPLIAHILGVDIEVINHLIAEFFNDHIPDSRREVIV